MNIIKDVDRFFANTSLDKLDERKKYLEGNATLDRVHLNSTGTYWSQEWVFKDGSTVEVFSRDGHLSWATK